MNLRTLLFLARKDLLKDIGVLILVLLAIGSGALAIIPLNGLLSGFTENMTATTIDVSVGHVVVMPEKGERYLKRLNQRLSEIEGLSDIVGVSPRLFERALIKKEDETDSITLRGIEPRYERQASTIVQKITEGEFLSDEDKGNITIGSTLASEFNLKIGDSIEIVFSNGKKDKFTIKGIYNTGLRDLDQGGYISLKELQGILGLRNRASEIAIRLTSADKSETFKSKLPYEDLVIETWQSRMAFIEQMQRNLNIIRTFMMVLSLIAAGIATSVLMYTNIQHKTRSIGILKAIGSNNRGVLILFMVEGIVLGIAGAIVGDVIGSLITLYLTQHPVEATMGISEGAATTVALKATFAPSFLTLPTITAVIITFLASLYPAWQASRINIIEAIWKG